MPDHDLSTRDGYFARFYELLFEFRECVAPTRTAWQQLEQERLSQCGRTWYTYKSFRSIVARFRGQSRSVVDRKML